MSAKSTQNPRKILASQITREPNAECPTNPRKATTERAGKLCVYISVASCPVRAVEGAVLGGFAEVFGREGGGAFQVGNGA
jgi:hypothetical protein